MIRIVHIFKIHRELVRLHFPGLRVCEVRRGILRGEPWHGHKGSAAAAAAQLIRWRVPNLQSAR